MKIRKIYEYDVLDYARKFNGNKYNTKMFHKNKYNNGNQENQDNINFVTFTDIINFQEYNYANDKENNKYTIAGRAGVAEGARGNVGVNSKNKPKSMRFSVDTQSLGNSRLSSSIPDN
jgi:hypothetical protein